MAADYIAPVGDNEIAFHIDFSKTSSQHGEPSNDTAFFMPSSKVMNASISYDLVDMGLSIEVYAKNLTKEADLKTVSRNFFNISRGVYQMPRQIGVRVKYNF